MAITYVDKEKHLVLRVINGRELRRHIVLADTVISVPPDGFKKIHNIYIEPDTGKLVVIHDE